MNDQAPQHPVEPPTCPYCGSGSRLVDSVMVYGVSRGLIYLCHRWPDCDAYVGVHPGTDIPLGDLANQPLRMARQRAHRAFDRLWLHAHAHYDIRETGRAKKAAIARIRRRMRKRSYAWLAEQLGIEPGHCHIGHFDFDTCDRVVALCEGTTTAHVRHWAKRQEAAV